MSSYDISVPKFQFGWRPRVEVILQGQDSECGLTCLAMILNFHGATTDLVTLRQEGAIGTRGTNLKMLSELADRLGMQTRALAIEMDELDSLRLPAIAHIGGNHFVVIEKVLSRQVRIVDPASGRRSVLKNAFSESFTGVVLECMPTDRVSLHQKATTQSWFKLLGQIRGIRSSLISILALALILEISVLFVPLFVQSVLDTVVVNHDLKLLLAIATAYAVVVTMQVAIGAIRAWAITVLSSSLIIGWSANVFRHLTRLSESYFTNRSIGDISSRFGSIGSIQRTLAVSSVEAALDGLMAALTLTMLFLYSAALGWIVVAGTVLYVGVRILAFRALMDSNIDLISANAKQETFFIESVRMIEMLRLWNAQSHRASSFIDHVTDVQKKTLRMTSITLVFASLATLVYSALKLAVLMLGATAVIADVFSAGMLVAFLAYVEQFTGRTVKLIDFVIEFRLLRIHTDRVRDIVATPAETGVEARYTGPIDASDVSFRGVFFRYSGDGPWIVANVSLDIADREFIGITGGSGQGKTTFLKLLVGLLDPSSGDVRIGGLSTSVLGKRRVRDLCGVVQQNDVLVSGTISQNIAGFTETPDLDRVRRAAKIAAVDAEVMEMPMRYETRVGDLGLLLSGGQRQRICIARALYKEPRILVLDEATSHVDDKLDAEIEANLAALQLTRIVVSHRASTLRSAHRVFVVEGGGVMECKPVRPLTATLEM